MERRGFDEPIRIRNSLVGGSTSLAIPRDRPLTWYSCGPTVYDMAHLGHARTYICSDVIRRILTDFFRIEVTFAMGVTDIDDKIIKSAKSDGRSASDHANYFETLFVKDMDSLNIRRPDMLLRVTEHVPDIIKYIQGIIQNGRAYLGTDGVYFDVKALGAKYGKLGRIGAPENQIEEELEFGKKDRQDFALWKLTDEEPNWKSPWGAGRPGWHIECSAMTHSFFGANVDIHSGGIDLAFPHHTNEIAQW
jgi:cysteinyl-tRNA synthetase